MAFGAFMSGFQEIAQKLEQSVQMQSDTLCSFQILGQSSIWILTVL